MKPREFDELVRQKFDRNDFAYNPKAWDQLAEQLDGRATKRSMLMWLWMPAMGMAASVALAIGVTSLFHFGQPDAGNQYAAYTAGGHMMPLHIDEAPLAMIHNVPVLEQPKPTIKTKTNPDIRPAVQDDKAIGIRLHNVVSSAPADLGVANNELQAPAPHNLSLPHNPEKKVAATHRKVYHTFREEVQHAPRKMRNLSVILSGGVNQGNTNSGYMAGATIRKMINDKVFVEGDVAFASSDNIQRTQYMSYEPAAPGTGGGGGTAAARPGSTASKTTTSEGANAGATGGPVGVIKTQDISYSLYYAQLTPSIGYKVAKRMSIGMGPDFQKMLVDNRPATSEVDRGNLQVAPSFDVGFIGKTEYALTKRVKAGVCYRKGINGVINPSDKYIDRDYIQFQMRCTIFNR